MSIKRSDYKTRKEWRWAVKEEAHNTGAPLGLRRFTANSHRANERMTAKGDDYKEKAAATRAETQARREARKAEGGFRAAIARGAARGKEKAAAREAARKSR